MYAKEKVRPKLYDLDQEKLSRLFADLRRESLATGSFPITVRHLESMIRMAEASAKMALREYVRADDIDLAISVTVGSFVNAQKMSIKKTLERVRHLIKLARVQALTCGGTGFPQISHSGTRPRRIACVYSRPDCEGESALLSVAEALAAGIYRCFCRRTRRARKFSRLPCVCALRC